MVREVLEGVGAALQVQRDRVDEIKTAASEACNNVVLHAYDGAEGPLEVELRVLDGRLALWVRDRGGGMRTHAPHRDLLVGGVGFAVIQSFTDRVEIRRRPQRGTEVLMEFGGPPTDGGARTGARAPKPPPAAAHKPPPDALRDTPAEEVLLGLRAGPLVEQVLLRLVNVLAVRARFSVDGLADAQSIVGALAASMPAAGIGEQVWLGVQCGRRTLELRLGARREDGDRRLLGDAPIARVLAAVLAQAGAVAGVVARAHLEAQAQEPLLIVEIDDQLRADIG